MRWLDISIPLREGMPLFPGDPPVETRPVASLAEGALCDLTALSFGLHSGTHLDAPRHFIPGAAGIESYAIETLCGPALVVDASRVKGHIDAAAFQGLAIPPAVERILFKTTNSALWERPGFVEDFVALEASAAQRLAASGARLVGIDYLSIAPFHDTAPTHRILLAAGIAILEGLDLRAVAPGPYELICLPLRIEGVDGAPARAMLRPA